MLPTSLKSVPYAEVVDINFTSANTLKRKFDDTLKENCGNPSEHVGNKKVNSCVLKKINDLHKNTLTYFSIK